MGWRDSLRFRFRSHVQNSKFEHDMDQEMHAHFEQLVEDFQAEGMSKPEAIRNARKEFGNIDRAKEECRDSWGTRLVFDFWRDLKHGFLQLTKTKGHSAIAIATLALSIGASTAIFSLVDKILLSELPIPNPQEIHTLYWTGENPRLRSTSTNYQKKEGDRLTADSISYPMYLSLKEASEGMSELIAFDNLSDTSIQIEDNAISLNGQIVSENFFEALEVNAFAGRLFETGKSETNTRSIVITYDLWRAHFASEPSAIGRRVRIYDTLFTIIGILPAEFPGIRQGDKRSFYVPISVDSPFLTIDITSDVHWGFQTMARVSPKTRTEILRQALSSTFANGVSRLDNPEIIIESSPGGLPFDEREYRKPLSIMLGVVATVLLVACLNLAGLSVASSAARKHELSVPAALGASRTRLIRQSLTESLALSSIGGMLGVLLANWGTSALSAMLAGSPDGLNYDFSIDLRIIAFALTTTLLITFIFGLLPALKTGSLDPLAGLRSRGSQGTNHQRLSKILVVAQVSVSAILLVVASLYLRSFINHKNIDTGFDHENLIIFTLNPGSAGYETEQRIQYYIRVQEELQNTPGIENATPMLYPLFSGSKSKGSFQMSDTPDLDTRERQSLRLAVGDTFFDTMDIPILSGRGFQATDTEQTQFVVVVNESFARKFTPNSSPIGLNLSTWRNRWTIIGVCADIKLDNIRHAIEPTTYFTTTQLAHNFKGSMRSASFAVRSNLPLEKATKIVQQTVARIDSNIPIHSITTQERLLQSNTAKDNLLATLCTALAALTIFLSCIGLYGLSAYSVKQKASEIAIRMAIGAKQSEVRWSILKGSISLAAIGAAISLPFALGIARIAKVQLYEVQTNTPLTFSVVTIGMLLVVVLGTWIPAQRAARIPPVFSLRGE